MKNANFKQNFCIFAKLFDFSKKVAVLAKILKIFRFCPCPKYFGQKSCNIKIYAFMSLWLRSIAGNFQGKTFQLFHNGKAFFHKLSEKF